MGGITFLTSSAWCSQPQVRGKKRNQTVGGIRQLQDKIDQIQTEQAESARHLQRLSDIHANLEPLLSRLSALLNAK